jgi:hypothetical protein
MREWFLQIVKSVYLNNCLRAGLSDGPIAILDDCKNTEYVSELLQGKESKI